MIPAISPARQHIFQCDRLSSIAFSFCAPKDLAVLKGVSCDLKLRVIATINSQLGQKKTVFLRELLEFQRYFKVPLGQVLALMHHVEQLDLEKATQEQLKDIFQSSRCGHLKTIQFKNCSRINEPQFLEFFSICSSVENLTLKCCRFTDVTLISIGKSCPKLQSLDLSNSTGFTGNGLAFLLKKSERLQSLSLEHCTQLQSADFIKLSAHCQKIKSLDLSLTHVEAASVAAIVKNCSELTQLNLDFLFNSFYVKDFQLFVSYLCKLTQIDLTESNGISDEIVSLLAKSCPRLEEVDLGMNPITQAGLEALIENCPVLSSLKLYECPNIDDACLIALATKGKALKKLDLEKTEKVTSAAIEMAKRINPNLTIKV